MIFGLHFFSVHCPHLEVLFDSRNVVDFPKFLGIAMETFLALCDDSESDVRMVADECLNRTIKVFLVKH